MINLMPKLNISSFKFLPKFTLKSKPKQYVADKPYVAYMPSLFFEPEAKNKSLLQEELVKNMAKALIKFRCGIDIDLDKKSDMVSKAADKTLSETISSTKSEAISSTRSETISDSYVKTKVETHKKHKKKKRKKHKVRYRDYSFKDSTVSKILKVLGKVVFAPVLLPVWGSLYLINKINDKLLERKYYKAEALAKKKQEHAELVRQKNRELFYIVRDKPIFKILLGEELYNRILSGEKFSLEQAENLIKRCDEALKLEAQRVQKLQKEITIELERYKKMFSPEDLVPDLSMFMPNALKHLSSEVLLKHLNVLKACISHQDIINNLKNKYLNGAKSYISDKEAENITNMKMEDDEDLNIKNGETYKSKLNRMCTAFLNESKSIETPILDFHNVSTKFFDRSKKNIEEIFELKDKWYYKYLEKVPKLGLVPKAMRVTGQLNLTRCIMKDYREVTDKYVKNGINPVISEYNRQFFKIKKFIEKNRGSLEYNDKKYSKNLLKKITVIRDKHIDTYSKLFDIYAKGGCNISNICKNVRFQGLASLVTKTIATFGTPF